MLTVWEGALIMVKEESVEEKVLVQVRVSPAMKARVVEAAGGPRKVSILVEKALEAFLAEKKPDGPAVDSPTGSPANQPRAYKVSEDELVWALLPEELYEEVKVRAERKSYSKKQIVVNSLAYMFKQHPLGGGGAQPVHPDDSAGTPVPASRIVDDPGDCKHSWADPVIKFGRRMSFCKYPTCEAKKLFD